MGAHMKTTIEIPTPVLEEAKRIAKREGVTLRVLVEEGLRAVVSERSRRKPFKLKDASVRGRGVEKGVTEGDWATIRDLIYEGRGA
ncbi:MAG: hypothetical protein A3J29_04655 [Acidobacteria bacterium RIFCSPLOWO2_12_FULL_67_14b]|nr:MAG: hypothetical protein A3J29_04655 [Acidobacteria bacterium RIFCSPLOWO2_12_FULL_67_14b]